MHILRFAIGDNFFFCGRKQQRTFALQNNAVASVDFVPTRGYKIAC